MSRYSVHPMEKKFIKDTTGVDLDAPPPDLVKKFNTQESDEIESLRKEVEKYHKAQQDFYIPNAALKAQVAELKKECSKLRHEEVRLLKQGIEKNLRILELREALERMLLCDVAEVRTIPRSCNALKSVRDVLATKDDTSTLEAYRNSVIDECVSVADEYEYVENAIVYMQGLKR